MRTIAIATLSALPCLASAAPLELAWQGRLLDAVGVPLHGPQTVTIDLYASDVAETPLWSDSFATSAEDGFVSVRLGVGTPLTTSIFGGGEVWLEAATTAGVVQPRTLLADVPFATVARGVRVEDAPASAACPGLDGELVFDRSNNLLRVCDGATWIPVGARTLVLVDGARQWTDGTAAKDCHAYRYPSSGGLYAGATGNGAYLIDPDGPGSGVDAFSVQCDMTTEDGGWIQLTLASAGSDQVYVTGGGRSNDGQARGGDQARHYAQVAGEGNFSTEFVHQAETGPWPDFTTLSIAYRNPATGSNFTEAQLDAMRANLTELGSDTRQLAGAVDDWGNPGGKGHEVQISDGNGANFLELTPGTQTSDEDDCFYWYHPTTTLTTRENVSFAFGGSAVAQLPITHLLPEKIRLGWFHTANDQWGGGAYWGYETSVVRVR